MSITFKLDSENTCSACKSCRCSPMSTYTGRQLHRLQAMPEISGTDMTCKTACLLSHMKPPDRRIASVQEPRSANWWNCTADTDRLVRNRNQARTVCTRVVRHCTCENCTC